MPADLARQALYAVLYYVLLALVLRLAGKRLAGQTTTFDLVVLIHDALEDEGMSRAELMAGLRKLGFAAPEEVELAVREETGHISAVRLEKR